MSKQENNDIMFGSYSRNEPKGTLVTMRKSDSRVQWATEPR